MDVPKYRQIVADMELDLQDAIEAEVVAASNLEEIRRTYGVVVRRRENLQTALKEVKELLPPEPRVLVPTLV